jgi:small Trp-rich protein
MSESKSSGGVGVLGLLGLLFITLKLIGVSEVATWSWWWVLSPYWMAFCAWLLRPTGARGGST